MENLIIIGTGGHAKVVIDILRESDEYKIVGCLAKDTTQTAISGLPILGTDDIAKNLYGKGITHAFVAIGDNKLRNQRAKDLIDIGFTLINVISSKSIISSSVQLGIGIVIMPGVVINVDTKIGDFSIINTNTSIDHDCNIGVCVHIAPGSSLAGNVFVGQGGFLGIGTKVIPNVNVGEWTTIGAGGTVIKDIPPYVVAVGTPVKIIKSIRQEI